jgi:hypothetical protein
MRLGVVVATVWLALAPPAAAGGPTMLVGATADVAKQGDRALAQAEVVRAKAAGFDTIRLTQQWLPGQTEPPGGDLIQLRNAVMAATVNRMKVLLVVSHPGSRTTPLADQQRSEFAQFTAALARAVPYVRHFTIGNEPNLNRFWLPQFGPNGENVAAPAYLQLLAGAYDALKAVDDDIIVLGGALSPRGSDNHLLSRHTHSPTKFIRDLGIAYRASGRTQPVMDAFSINPFPDNSSVAPTVGHPRSTSIGVADYDKLVKLLGEAFDGTAQKGSTLPIYYGEFGVESVPPAAKAGLYTGAEPTTTKPVDEATQAKYYRQAVQLAFCQPNVQGIFLFHTIDDASRPGWQSGVYYPDKSAKTSLAGVKQAARQSRGGVVARCAGMRLTPRVTGLGVVGGRRYGVYFTCSIDCTAVLTLERVRPRRIVKTFTGRALGGVRSVIRLPRMKLARGTYRFVVSFSAPVNTGDTVVQRSAPFGVR